MRTSSSTTISSLPTDSLPEILGPIDRTTVIAQVKNNYTAENKKFFLELFRLMACGETKPNGYEDIVQITKAFADAHPLAVADLPWGEVPFACLCYMTQELPHFFAKDNLQIACLKVDYKGARTTLNERSHLINSYTGVCPDLTNLQLAELTKAYLFARYPNSEDQVELKQNSEAIIQMLIDRGENRKPLLSEPIL